MEKVLLLCQKFCGYEEIIVKQMSKMGYDVTYLEYDIGALQKYNNVFEKFYNNVFLKPFTKKTLKDSILEKNLNKLLLNCEEYDSFLKIGPIVLHDSSLDILKKKCKKMVNVYWDTIENKDIELRGREYFDSFFSYDKSDCKKYNLRFLPNFYYEKSEGKKIECDLFMIMGNQDRLWILEEIAKQLKKHNIDYIFKVFLNKKNIKSDYVEIIEKKMPIKEVTDLVQKSKAMLDLKREGQGGLSFRAIEALGMKKKLITTNKEIVNFDFYNPNNIMIIDEKKPVLNPDFFRKPYVDLSDEIYEKYSLERWVQTILS